MPGKPIPFDHPTAGWPDGSPPSYLCDGDGWEYQDFLGQWAKAYGDIPSHTWRRDYISAIRFAEPDLDRQIWLAIKHDMTPHRKGPAPVDVDLSGRVLFADGLLGFVPPDAIAWRDGRIIGYHRKAEPVAASPDTVVDNLGGWLSAALDDPAVCDARKADINAWFAAGQPSPDTVTIERKTLEEWEQEAPNRLQKHDVQLLRHLDLLRDPETPSERLARELGIPHDDKLVAALKRYDEGKDA